MLLNSMCTLVSVIKLPQDRHRFVSFPRELYVFQALAQLTKSYYFLWDHHCLIASQPST